MVGVGLWLVNSMGCTSTIIDIRNGRDVCI